MFSHWFLDRPSSLNFGRTSKMAWDMLVEISHEPSTKTIWCVGNVDKHIDGSYFTCKGHKGHNSKSSKLGMATQTAFRILDVRRLLKKMSHKLLGIYHRIIADNPSRIESRPTYESFMVKICQVLVIPLRESIGTYSYI